ncbi:phage major capsid protein [Clostridium perfringens]|nr:phage major capsid protein [Clostridium perfringens]MDK0602573.1 phage major capsid protein [Clostridium perfringens]
MLREKVKNLFNEAKEIGNVQIMSVEIAQNVLDVPNVATFCDTVITNEKVLLIEDDDNIEAEVLGEKENATDNNIVLKGHGILGKEKTRITTNVTISKLLLNDTDNTEDFYKILNKRVARKLSKVIVNGNEKFKGKSLCNVDKSIEGECSIDNLRALMLEMKQEYLANACFIVSEDKFKILSKEKQANGEYYINYSKENGLYEIFGVPMMIMDTLNCNALLVDIKNAYKLVVSPTIDLRDFSQDAMAQLQGADGISLSLYFDGGIKNTNAVKKLSIGV